MKMTTATENGIKIDRTLESRGVRFGATCVGDTKCGGKNAEKGIWLRLFKPRYLAK